MNRLIEARLETHAIATVQDLVNALREISQSIALAALFRAGFFKRAAFHGGTCLRIFHGLRRFSEDLDFCLFGPDTSFSWGAYERALATEFDAFGLELRVQDRSDAPGNIKKAFIKSDAVGRILDVRPMRIDGRPKQMKIKVEVDTNPPRLADLESRYLDWPDTVPVICHDLPTGFAGRLHALLCREYAKGRDWYDFVWYTGRETPINIPFLQSALEQDGPWQGRSLAVDDDWIATRLEERIDALDWPAARKEITRFVQQKELPVIESWTADLLVERARRLRDLPRTSPR